MLHERHIFVAQEPTRWPRRHRLHHVRAGLRGNPMTAAVQVEGHVFPREPASRAHRRPGETAVPALGVPFDLSPEGRNAEVAQLTEDDSEQGTRREFTNSFMSSCMRKYPWVPGEKALCANKPYHAVDDERPSRVRRERHFRDPVELESLVHVELLPARKRDHPRQDRVRETGGHRVSARHLLAKVFAEPSVGAGYCESINSLNDTCDAR